MFSYWNFRWNTQTASYSGMIGDHAHLWLCFKPFLKGMDYIKFFLYSTNMTIFFFLWLLKPSLVYATKRHLPKHLTVLAISVKTTMLGWNSPGIIIWSLGITYFRWLYAPLFKSEPWIITLSKIIWTSSLTWNKYSENLEILP